MGTVQVALYLLSSLLVFTCTMTFRGLGLFCLPHEELSVLASFALSTVSIMNRLGTPVQNKGKTN